MDFNKIKLLINTVIHLRAIQIYYRFYYFSRNRLFRYNVEKRIINDFNPIVWKNRIDYENSYFKKENSFTFLNVLHSFSDKINWNINQFQELLFQQENGGNPIIPFDEIVNTTKASFAAIESLKEGKWISIK